MELHALAGYGLSNGGALRQGPFAGIQRSLLGSLRQTNHVPPGQDTQTFRGLYAFSRQQDGSFLNGSASARIRFHDRGRFHVTTNGADGEQQKFAGLQTSEKSYFRTPEGHIVQADVYHSRRGDEFGIFHPEEVVRSDIATGDGGLKDSLLVRFREGTSNFGTEDGSFRGFYDAEKGRVGGYITDDEGNEIRFDGLAGNGFVVASLEDGREVKFRFAQLSDGSFLLRGLKGFLEEPTGNQEPSADPNGQAAPLLADSAPIDPITPPPLPDNPTRPGVQRGVDRLREAFQPEGDDRVPEEQPKTLDTLL